MCNCLDALALPEVSTAASHGGQEGNELTAPQSLGSTLEYPHIGAGWGRLKAGASKSNDEQIIEGHNGA
ncbi:TPA: hypothetical protein ACH3X2_011726 [Trebouxia sp. C0005]